MSAEISVHTSEQDLLSEVTLRLANLLASWSEERPFRIALTGGTLGIEVLRFFDRAQLDPLKLEVFWGDERWVPIDHSDRNDGQAFAAWPSLTRAKLHPFASPVDLSIDAAAATMNEQFEECFGVDPLAGFDLLLLGVGPDGHVASLFPGKSPNQNRWVVFEEYSPKPPPIRLSFSYEALNLAQRVWFMAVGQQKADVVSEAINMPGESDLPCARVNGRVQTVWFIDSAMAEKFG